VQLACSFETGSEHGGLEPHTYAKSVGWRSPEFDPGVKVKARNESLPVNCRKLRDQPQIPELELRLQVHGTTEI